MLLLSVRVGYCQSVALEGLIKVSFSAKLPDRLSALRSPGDFISKGVLEAKRKALDEFPACFYGTGQISFRLTAPNKIDSIRITGDYLPEWITDFYESRILSSQPYWHYIDTMDTGPILVLIPIDFAFGGDCAKKPSVKYTAEVSAIDSLFRNSSLRLPDIDAIQQNPKQILLQPMWLYRMR